MPFDPKAYVQKLGYPEQQGASMPNGPAAKSQETQDGFDPKAYIAKVSGQPVPQPEDQPKTSAAQAGLEHFGQAASMGYLPQLQALAEPLTDKLYAAMEGKQAPENNKDYVQRRDENISRMNQEAKEHPYAALGGLLAGSVAGGAGVAGAMPSKIKQLSMLKQAALTGGAQGLIQNPGDTEGQLSGPQLEERAKGGAIGAAVGGAAEKLLGGIQQAPAALKEFAQTKAFKSSGAMLKDFRKAFSRDQVNELGQSMIDNKLIGAGMTFDSVAEKSAQIKQQTGKQIGEIYDRLSDLAQKNPDSIRNSFAIADPETVASDLTSAVRNSKVMPKLNAQAYRETMDKMIDQIASSGQTHDVRFLNDVIGEIDNKINWSKRTPEMSDLQQGLVAMRRTLRQKVNDIADRLGGTDEALSQQLKILNKQYGNMTEINRIAIDRTGREQANRLLSPSDYGTAGIGALIGSQFGSTPEERLKHAVMGAGLGVANKAARLYGNPLMVQAASKAGQALAPLSNVPNNPALVGAGAAGIANQQRR